VNTAIWELAYSTFKASLYITSWSALTINTTVHVDDECQLPCNMYKHTGLSTATIHIYTHTQWSKDGMRNVKCIFQKATEFILMTISVQCVNSKQFSWMMLNYFIFMLFTNSTKTIWIFYTPDACEWFVSFQQKPGKQFLKQHKH
jgi:hypothetical protein